MIDHLKNIHRELYLPQAPAPVDLPFKVTPISEPYLYTDRNLYLDSFDSPNQSVKVKVSNVGGGRLQVERIRIPRVAGTWVKRAKGSRSVTLTSASDPVEIELNLLLKDLPNPSTVNVAELHFVSNSKRKTFSEILLGVRPPENQTSHLTVPDYINFGEITVWKVVLANRHLLSAPPIEFLLITDFTRNPPTSLEITQIDKFSFDAKMCFPKGVWHYKLDLRAPGAVKPRLRLDSREINLKSMQQTLSIGNVHQNQFSGPVTTSDMDWLAVPNKIDVAGYRTVNFSVLVKPEKLKPGKNFGELVVSDKKIPVWAWFKIVNETTLTLDQDQPNIHYIEELATQEKPLPIEVSSAEEPYQSVMIFEDLDFQFPLAGEERIGYLMGDFNGWNPRTLFLEQRDDGFGATLSIPEGTYLYRAEIDGEMRLDPARLHEIVCCPHGLASKIQIKRMEQKVTLQNRSKQRLELKLQSSAKWLRIKPETIVLPAQKKSEITVVFRPERLSLGLNLGWIQMETEKAPKRSLHAPIFVIGITNGAVPILRNNVLDFPQIEQGKEEGIPLELDIFGEGELRWEVQPSTVLGLEGKLHVQNETTSEPMKATPLLQVLSEKPSNAYRKQIHASLVTDCYLANRRVLPFIAKYDMVHLVSDPPALYFPKVYLFDDPQYADVMVKRSDEKDVVECAAEIPKELSQMGLLKKVEDNRTSQCAFVLDPQAVSASERFTGSLRLKDENSGMSLPIQFAADIVGGQAKIEVKTQKQGSNLLSDGIPLVITNVGETELRIFEVRFKNLRFHLSPHLTSQQRTLRSGESIDRLIKANRTIGLFGKRAVSLLAKTTVRDTLTIRLNDSQFPNGVFEKEIVAEIRGRSLN